MSEDTKLKELIINTLSPEQMPEVLSETEIYLVEDDAEYATVEELAEKQDKTDNSLTTTDKTVTGAINELGEKIKDIELFKFPNALIIGEPTINNGQVSDFSQTSYLALPFLFDVHDRAFEFDYAFRTSDDITTPQNLFGSKYCIASYISDGKLTVRVSSNGTSWNALDIITDLDVQANTTYYIKLVFNRLNYTILASTNGTDYSQIGYKVTTEKPHAGEVFIGIGNNQNNPFLGIINLHKWMIKLNNAVIWQGMDDAGLATRADISLSNLDEQGETRFEAKQDVIEDLDVIRSNASTGAGLAQQVAVNTQRNEDLTTARIPDVIYHGTPKITGGQISNFSTTNYLQFPFEDISRSLPFDIYFSFTTSDDVTTQQNIIDSRFGIALAIQNGKGVMALSSNGSSWDIGSATGTNTLLSNATYYVKYSWTGTEYNASLSTNEQTYVPDMILQSNKSPYKTTIYIGGCDQEKTGHTPHPFKGIINFTKSRVVVNNITVWEGMADVGIASRANVSLNNLDEVGEKRFTDLQDAIDGKQPAGDYATNTALTTHAGNTTIHVTANDKTAWSQKQNAISDLDTIRSGASAGATAYQKPSTGIPKTDLASAVQTSLGKADTAIQSTADCVKTSGNQTVAGVKTFTGNPVFQSANLGEAVTVKRTDTNSPAIAFSNSDGIKGYIGTDDKGNPVYWNSSKTGVNILRNTTLNTAVGSASVPVYINTNGVATVITSYSGNSATATTATNANNLKVSEHSANNTVYYPIWANGEGGSVRTCFVTKDKLNFIPASGKFMSTQLSVNNKVTMNYNTTTEALEFTFT